MKKIECEMCGDKNLIKQDGVFVCQSCGTQYSVEEAKKMMVEGTIKVDSSDKIENLYILARRAKDNNDAETAEKYYEMISLEEPNSWEAVFYHIYFKSIKSKNYQIMSVAKSVANSINDVLILIKQNVEDITEQEKAIDEVAYRYKMLSDIFYEASKSIFDNASKSSTTRYVEAFQTYFANALSAIEIMYKLGDNLESLFPENEKFIKVAVADWIDGTKKHIVIMPYAQKKRKENWAIINSYQNKIKKYDPNYRAPRKQGCYVATSVYGSYDCPDVWVLRRYRDEVLANNIFGRAFISTYYTISPTLVKFFGKATWFNKICRPLLDRKVKKLTKRGFSDTPYYDR